MRIVESFSYRREIWRKAVHLSSLWMPLLYLPLSREAMLVVLLPLTGIVVSIDALRQRHPWLRECFQRYFGAVLRPHETGVRMQLTGASYVMIAACLVVALSSKPVAVAALMVLVVSDSAAALVGRKWGRTPLYGGKTVEGSAAFFVSALAAAFFSGWVTDISGNFYLAAGVASGAATLAELYAKKIKIDDNLLIPMIFSLVATVVFVPI